MAKTVNLTAVEKLSTYNEHTNLIVEQEGELNRVAIADLKISSSEIYKQDEEPIDAPEGALWIDTDEESVSGGGGVTSWNDLTDKPFEEIVTTSDTLTWDGNTEGLISITGTHYKVYDNVPTAEDLANGYETTLNNGVTYTDADYLLHIDGVGAIHLGYGAFSSPMPIIVIVPNDETPYGQKGIYFLNIEGIFAKSLKIPGYTFEIKETKLDKKYIPSQAIMPEVTTEDNGKFLRVVDGAWVAVSVPYAEEASF